MTEASRVDTRQLWWSALAAFALALAATVGAARAQAPASFALAPATDSLEHTGSQ
jgi:hypothetical protein